MGTDVPAGWYPDPHGETGAERWFDGTAWTWDVRDATWPVTPHVDHTQQMAPVAASETFVPPPTADAPAQHGPLPPPRTPGALVALLGIVLLAGFGAIWWAVSSENADESQEEVADSGSVEVPDPDADTDGEESAAAPLQGDSGQTESVEDPNVDSSTDEPMLVELDFDGACTVETTSQDAESAPLRPWQFPECDWAPVPLDPGERRWIVVVSSLNGFDFDDQNATARANSVNGAQVLWSSHYPSLNPDLWVVFRGPYRSEADAAAAASATGSGAYARELSDDAGDRYCDATDGCRGERSN